MRAENGLVNVRVQFPLSDRKTVDQLKDVRVRAEDGTLVPIADIATLEWTKAPLQIKRLNRQRVVDVYGGTLPGYSLGAVTGPLEKQLRKPGFLPEGVQLTAQGDTQYMIETMANMGVALLTSFMLVYMLMVILYGSFLEPLIVMFCVPLAVDRCARRALDHAPHRAERRAVAQHHLDDRHRHALRIGRQERNLARGLLEYALPPRHARARRGASSGEHAIPSDSDDDVCDDLRHAAARRSASPRAASGAKRWAPSSSAD